MTQVRITVTLKNGEELQSAWSTSTASAEQVGGALHQTKSVVFAIDDGTMAIIPAKSVRYAVLETRDHDETTLQILSESDERSLGVLDETLKSLGMEVEDGTTSR